MTREQIVHALERLNARLAAAEARAQLFVVDGAVLCLVHETRTSTRDVDAWFTEPRILREAAGQVAVEMDLPADWLDDAAKGFIPENAGFERWRKLSHLDISIADDRTLLAMKCAAARTAEDAADIRYLLGRLGLCSVDEVLAVVLKYYPPEQLPVRTRLLLEEMLQDVP